MNLPNFVTLGPSFLSTGEIVRVPLAWFRARRIKHQYYAAPFTWPGTRDV